MKEQKLIPKVSFGTDKKGCCYVFVKLSDMTDRKFLDEIFVLYYQPYSILNWSILSFIVLQIIKGYPVTNNKFEPSDKAGYFFIRKVLFPRVENWNSFQNNMVENIANSNGSLSVSRGKERNQIIPTLKTKLRGKQNEQVSIY